MIIESTDNINRVICKVIMDNSSTLRIYGKSNKAIIRKIKKNPNVTKLWLDCCFNETELNLEDVYDAIKNMTFLKEIDIDSSFLYKDKIYIINRLANLKLKSIKIRNSGLSHNDILMFCKNLKGNMFIKELNLNNNSINNDTMIHLKELQLEKLHLWNAFPSGKNIFLNDGIKIILENNTTLTDLNIGCSRFDNQGLKYLGEELKINTTLKILDMSYSCLCNNNPIGIKYLYEAIKVNNCLTKLDLSKLVHDSQQLSDDFCKELGEILKINKSIRVLILKENSINKSSLKHLCGGLIMNNSLTDLDLGGNLIGHSKHFGNYLKINTSLKHLNLKWNWQSQESVVNSLCDALKVNCTLKSLDLDFSNIHDMQITNLCESLKINKSLEEISLNNNKITSVKPIIEMLKYNIVLKEISLINNSVDNFKEQVFIKLSRNKKIQKIIIKVIIFLIGVRQYATKDPYGIGYFIWFPKEIVKMIAKEIWKTRGDTEWLKIV